MRTRCESWASRRMCLCPLAADAMLRWMLRVEFSRCCWTEASVETLCCAADRREALSISSGVSRVSLGVSLSDTLKKTEETAVTHRIKQLVLKGHFTQKLSFSHRLFSLMVFQISDFLSLAKHTNIIFCLYNLKMCSFRKKVICVLVQHQ